MESNKPIPEVILPAMLRQSFDRMPEPWSVVNSESRYIYANLALAKLVGFSTPDGLIGRLYHEVQAKIFDNEASRQAWQQQDQQVLSDPSRNLKMLEIHPDAALSPFTVEKIPLFDGTQVVGLIHHNRYVEALKPNDFIRGRKPGSLLLNKPDDTFTEKECEIIFLRLQGLTSKKIGSLLFKSHRTVENMLQNIYLKAGVSHADDFEHYCEERNFDRYLPRRFLDSHKILF